MNRLLVFARAGLILLMTSSCVTPALARESDTGSEVSRQLISLEGADGDALRDRVWPQLAESYKFFGLAGYYNLVDFYIWEGDELSLAEAGMTYQLSAERWLIARGRFNVFSLGAGGVRVTIGEQTFHTELPSAIDPGFHAILTPQSEIGAAFTGLKRVPYAHLGFLGPLAQLMEATLVAVHRFGVENWGAAIVVFGILLKILLLPVGIATVRLQRRVSQVTAKLTPQIDAIKAHHTGEEAHNRIMEAHKKEGVTPFYTLKPLATSLIQVPILVAVFNVLGTMPELQGQSFLWIADLAYPDSVGTLPMAVPLLGDRISLLPCLMTAVTIFSTVIFRNRHATDREMRSQRRNLYLMAAGFFVLFYPFPAAMVLYWTCANILQTIQQKFVKV